MAAVSGQSFNLGAYACLVCSVCLLTFAYGRHQPAYEHTQGEREGHRKDSGYGGMSLGSGCLQLSSDMVN